jgi:hypothetical protein
MKIELTPEEIEWVGISLRSARDQIGDDDPNWDGTEPDQKEEAIKALGHINSVLNKLGENEHPSFRLKS